MYTVMVAAMDKRVVAVDPILNNLAIINQSLQRSKKSQHVSFIRNPIRCLVLIFSANNHARLSDQVERLYPVTNNTANQGGTRLIPANLMTPGLMAAVSGDPVVSTTLAHLVTFTGADTVIIKLDIEVRTPRVVQTLCWT